MSLRILLAAVVGAVVAFGLGFVCYVLVFADFFAANGWEILETPTLWAIFAGEFVMAYLLAHLFANWASINTLSGGAKGGALIGGMVTLSVGLIIFGAQGQISLTSVIADSVIAAARWAAAGAAIGAMLGRG